MSAGHLENYSGRRTNSDHHERSEQKIVDRVLEYRAPLDCERLAILFIPGLQVFVGRFLGKGKKRLRYLPADSIDDIQIIYV